MERVKKLLIKVIFGLLFFGFNIKLEAVPIRYGGLVRLKDSTQNVRLHSHGPKYYPISEGHQTSRQQQVTGFTGVNAGNWWIVQSAETPAKSGDVKSGDKIMLQHANTNQFLHTHGAASDYRSPDLEHKEVTCFGQGAANSGNHWKIIVYDNGSPASVGTIWDSTKRVVFESILNVGDYLWVSGSSFDVLNRPSAPVMQRIVALNTTPTYWVIQTYHDPITDALFPGTDTFSYIPFYQDSKLSFAPNWKLPVTGKGYVQFKAQAVAAIRVEFATHMNQTEGSGYVISIGVAYNRQTVFQTRSGTTHTVQSKFDCAEGKMSPVAAYGGLLSPDTPDACKTMIKKIEDYYWVKVDGVKVSFGRSATAGENQIVEWTAPTQEAVQYVGLGGGGYGIRFSEIKISPVVPTPQETEIQRVQGVLSGLAGKSFAEQFAGLQGLVTSVATTAFDYATVQDAFWTAVTNMHNARPKTDQASLTGLKTWYAALSTSKLFKAANQSDLNTKISQIDADLQVIAQAAAAPAPTAQTLESQITSEVNSALAASKLLQKIKGLTLVATKYKTQTVSSAVMNTFAQALGQLRTQVDSNYTNLNRSKKSDVKNVRKEVKNYIKLLTRAAQSKLLSTQLQGTVNDLNKYYKNTILKDLNNLFKQLRAPSRAVTRGRGRGR